MDPADRSLDDDGEDARVEGIDAVVLRRAPGRDVVDEWALVLAAVGIPFRAGRPSDGDGWYEVRVPTADAPRATRALAAYDLEARQAPPTSPPAPNRGTGALGVAVGLLLVAFAFRTGYWESASSSRWFAVGVADASRIRAGEWWRAVTAMTLHADGMHLFGNVAASLIFVSAAGRWLGPGLAAALIVLAGTGANLLTAVAESRDHLSVGASTATFAALGLVVGLQSVRRWRGGGHLRRRAWIAAGAGLALLGMLGMGARADVFAHAFGLGLGFVLGLATGLLDPPRAAPGRTGRAWVGQMLLAAATLGAVAAAWWRACLTAPTS